MRNLADAQVVHARVKRGAEDAITIADQPLRHDLRADGLHNLLRGPRGVRVRRHVHVEHAAAFERQDEEYVNDVERHRRHRQRSRSRSSP